MLLAVEHWPDVIDFWATFGLLGVALAAVVAGYAFMVVDFRAYLRSLPRVLARVVRHFPQVPEWARYETPAAVAAFGLRMPCTEDDLKQAYRLRVKKLHPDRGGDKRKFLRLQTQFEEALKYLREQARLRSGPLASEQETSPAAS